MRHTSNQRDYRCGRQLLRPHHNGSFLDGIVVHGSFSKIKRFPYHALKQSRAMSCLPLKLQDEDMKIEVPQPRIVALSVKRPRDADRKGFYEHLQPKTLAISLVTGAATSISSFIEEHMKLFGDDIEKMLMHFAEVGLGDDFFETKKKPFLINTIYYTCKTICKTTFLRFLEYIVWDVLSFLKIAGKLTKDVVKSATRKVARFGRLGALWPTFQTALWSNALNWTSILVVDWVFVIGECAVEAITGTTEEEDQNKVGKSRSRVASFFVAVKKSGPRFRQQAVGAATSYICISTGAAVGTLLWPGKGTGIGSELGGLLPLLK